MIHLANGNGPAGAHEVAVEKSKMNSMSTPLTLCGKNSEKGSYVVVECDCQEFILVDSGSEVSLYADVANEICGKRLGAA